MHAAARRAALETAFERIWHERMQGVALLHPVLRVQALGFEPRADGRCLGALITPWFLNLMLLPMAGGPEDGWPAPGKRARQRFAGAELVFLGGEEQGVGPYQSCALFSDMRPFADQAAAAAVAAEALTALDRAPPARAAADGPARNLAGQAVTPMPATVAVPLAACAPSPSRRRLLFGR